MVLVHQKEIIKVPADLPGRIHFRIDIELGTLRIGRKDIRQHVRLDPCRKLQLRPDPFLLGRDPLHLRDVPQRLPRQLREGLRQLLDFVPRAVGLLHLKLQILPAHRPDAPGHQLHRLHHPGRHIKRRDQREREHGQRQHQRRLLRMFRPRLEGALRLRADFVVLSQHRLCRQVRKRAVHHAQQRPAHAEDRYARHVVFLPLGLDLLQLGRGLHRPRHEIRQLRTAALTQVRRLRRQRGPENALRRRGEEHLPVPVHDAQKAALGGCVLHIVPDRVEKDVRPDHGLQLSADIDRRRAHQTRNARVRVLLHPGEDQLARLGRLPVPGPLPHREVPDPAVLIDVVSRPVAGDEQIPVRRRDETRAQLFGVCEHRQHHFAHVRRQTQCLGIAAPGPRLVQRHHRCRTVVLGLRPGNGMLRHALRMGENLLRQGLQRQHVRLHVPEQIPGDIGLQCRRLLQRALQHRVHRLLRDRRDRCLLPGLGLPHDPLQILRLVRRHGHIGAHQRQNEDQHQIENPLLQPPDCYSTDFFHSFTPRDADPIQRSAPPGNPTAPQPPGRRRPASSP